jgi:hypothetical protein
MGMCPIPKEFVSWFGKIPSKITLHTNIGCKWGVTTKVGGEKAIIY